MAYQHLTTEQKDNLWYLLHLAHPPKIAEIARMLNKHRSTIYREIKSNTFDGKYSSSISKKKYIDKRLKANSRLNKILSNHQLEKYILTHLKLRWSPDQIANRWNIETYNQAYISYPTIYKYLYERRELWQYLRHKKNKYRRRYGTNIRIKSRKLDSNRKSIHDRPVEIAERKTIGHFEGDTMVLSPRSACLLTHVDRKTKYTLVDLLENHEKETIRKQTIKTFKNIDVESITYDNGVEFNDYEKTERKLGIDIYFADTYASYQRGTNENTNGLIRDWFPKKTKYDTLTINEVKKAQTLLNNRPRKCLEYHTPYEVFFNTVCRTLNLN